MLHKGIIFSKHVCIFVFLYLISVSWSPTAQLFKSSAIKLPWIDLLTQYPVAELGISTQPFIFHVRFLWCWNLFEALGKRMAHSNESPSEVCLQEKGLHPGKRSRTKIAVNMAMDHFDISKAQPQLFSGMWVGGVHQSSWVASSFPGFRVSFWRKWRDKKWFRK